jgi:hypothetical protein
MKESLCEGNSNGPQTKPKLTMWLNEARSFAISAAYDLILYISKASTLTLIVKVR